MTASIDIRPPVNVYRLEHVEHCNGARPNHGPHIRAGCETPHPPFGTTGWRPRSITGDEVCGVTARQARYWWTHGYSQGPAKPDDIVRFLSSGWQFVHYRVPADAARIDRGQVVFDPSHAERVGPVGFPRELCSDRRTTYLSCHRYHELRSTIPPVRMVTA